MKKLFVGTLVLVSLLMLSSCEKQDRFNQMKPEKPAKVVKTVLTTMEEWPGESGTCLMSYQLMAGQTILAGNVRALIFDDQLFVKYEALDGFMITEAHLFVGNTEAVIPAGQSGNPKIGHFPYFWENQGSAEEVIFNIDLENLDVIDGCIKIAAHAVVVGPGGEETAWAYGDNSVFALKSLMDTSRNPSQQWLITGIQAAWCENFSYYSIEEALLGPIDLVLYVNGEKAYGQVAVELIGDMYRFTITSKKIGGKVYRSHFVAGTIDLVSALLLDCKSYQSFETIDTPDGADNHVFYAPAGASGDPFDGHRWGWSVNYCPPCL